MAKTPAQIRLIGDKVGGYRYIRPGLQELFRLEERAKLEKVPVLQNVVELDEYTTVLVQIVNDQRFVQITHNPPPPGEEKKEEELEELKLRSCPPAFVIYARERLTGETTKDYIIAYNENTDAWQLATVDPYQGAANTGYWPEHDKGDNHAICDVLTWSGQGGGFGDLGWRLYGGDSHSTAMFMSGYRIWAPGLVYAAGIFNNQNGEKRYYVLSPAGTKTTWRIHEGTMPAPDASGDISPSWTLKKSFAITDYCDAGTGQTAWLPLIGNAFVNEDGFAYLATPIAKLVEPIPESGSFATCYANHLLKIDLRNFTLSIIRSDIDAAPQQSTYFTEDFESSTVSAPNLPAPYPNWSWMHVLPQDYELCSSDGTTTGQNGPRTDLSVTSGFHDSTWGGYSHNRGRPMLLRTFGGLDTLYTYEMETDWFMNGEYHSTTTPYQPTKGIVHNDAVGCIPAYQIPHNFNWWAHQATVTSVRNEIERGTATIYCYDNGTDYGKRKIIDQINVWELQYDCACSETFTDVDSPLNETNLALFKEAWGTSTTFSIVQESTQPSSGGPGGLAQATLIRRTVIDHHPKIKNSWVYIETRETFNPLSGTFTQKEVKFVDMLHKTPVRAEVTGAFYPTNNASWVTHWDPYYKNLFPSQNVECPALRTGFSKVGHTLYNHEHLDWYRGAAAGLPVPIDYFGVYHYGYWDMRTGVFYSGNRAMWQWGWGTYRPNTGAGAYTTAYRNGYNGGNEYVLGLFCGGWAGGTMEIQDASTWGTGWHFNGGGSMQSNGPGSVAVHRPIKKGKVPYIWLKRKVHADTGAFPPYTGKWDLNKEHGMVRPAVVSSSLSPSDFDAATYPTDPNSSWWYVFGGSLNNGSDGCIFWTRELQRNAPEAESFGTVGLHWQRLAELEEWYIESNILTDEQILYLTKEAQLDIYGIAII